MRTNLLLLSTLGLLVLSQPSFAGDSDTAQTVKKVSNGIASATNPNSPSTLQIESTVRDYLKKKPEVVVEALQAYQQKQMDSMQQLFKETQKLAPQNADVLFHQSSDPVGGNPKGKVTIVEFSDYQCSHCIETAATVDAAIKANPELRIVVKEFPIRGGLSETAARAALASSKQNKYWAFRDALFQNGMSLTEEKIYELAKGVGLNVDQLKKDMNEEAIRTAVTNNQKLAQSLKLVGTPAFFVAKSDVVQNAPSAAINYIPGVVSQPQLQTVLDQLSH